jgi:hypothetical protein
MMDAVSLEIMWCFTPERGLSLNIVFLSKSEHKNIVLLSKGCCVPG